MVVPTRKGFGSQLIERVLVGDFGGVIEVSYAPSGLRCKLVAPMQNLRNLLPSPFEAA